MKNILKVNHDNRTIVMDKTFAKFAAIVGTDEYVMLQGARGDYPNYTVITRTIKKNPSKESYRGLTYTYMERYIILHENAEKNLAEYYELRLRAECHSIRYPYIKAWFLKTYPEVANFGLYSLSSDNTDLTEAKNTKVVELPVNTSQTPDAA